MYRIVLVGCSKKWSRKVSSSFMLERGTRAVYYSLKMDYMNYLETGALYFSNIKTDEVVLINFHTKNSVPVSFFEKLKKAEIEHLKAKFDELCHTNLSTYGWYGRLIIVSMYYLTTKTDMIVVNASGLANDLVVQDVPKGIRNQQ